MSLTIQHPLRTDLSTIIALNEMSMPEQYLPAFWTHHLNQFGDMFYVAKFDGKVIGYVMCREERINYTRMGLVISVAVDLQYRGQEIGPKLMYEAHRAMRERNIPMAALQVRKSNEAAIKMYEKLGYSINLKIPQYYKNPSEDAWLMTAVL